MKKKNSLAILGVCAISVLGCKEDTKNNKTEASESKASEPKASEPASSDNASKTKPNNTQDTVKESSEKEKHPSDSKVMAKFSDGHTITNHDVSKELSKLPDELQKNYSYSDLTKIILEGKINEYLLDKEIVVSKFEDTPDAKKQLEKVKTGIEQKAFLGKKVKTASDQDVQKKYSDLNKEFVERKETEVLLRHIVVATQSEAMELIKTLQNDPKKFQQMTMEKSLDAKTKAKGGELNYVRRGVFPKEYEEKIFGSAPGTVLEQPLPYEDKFSVVQIGEARLAEFPKLEVIKDRIIEMLKAEQILGYLKDLRQSKKVKVMDYSGKEMAEPDRKSNDLKDEKEVDVTKIDINRVIIDFGSRKYTVKDLKDFCKENNIEFLMTSNPMIYQQIIFQVCHSELLKDEVGQSGIQNEADTKSQFAEMKQNVLRQGFIEDQVNKKITDAEIEKTYREIKSRFPKGEIEALIRLIPFNSQTEAENALADIKKNPKKFDEYVKNCKFKDIRDNNGYLNATKNAYLTRKQMSSGAASKVLASKPATIVSNVVEHLIAGASNIPYAVVRVENKRDVQPPRKEEIMKELSEMTKRRLMGDFMKVLQKKYGIEKFDDNGKPLVEESDRINNLDDFPTSPGI